MPINEPTLFNQHQQILCRELATTDIHALHQYLQQLGDETKKQFGPHSFEIDALIHFYNADAGLTAYIAEDTVQGSIIAYAILKNGCLLHDRERLESYGLQTNDTNCCTFAPSVADNWQSKGIGKTLFNHIVANLKGRGIKKIILWGGVQASNKKAMNFYRKMGFQTLGTFEYNGANFDMALDL